MTQVIAFKEKGSLGASEDVTLSFLPQSGVTIMVSNSADLTTAQVTVDDPADAAAIWCDITFTANACVFVGPVRGIYLEADASGCDYAVLGVTDLG